MDISTQDIDRLNREVQTECVTHEVWAEKRNIPCETLGGTAGACASGVFQAMFEAIEEQMPESESEEPHFGIAVAKVGGNDLQSLIENACRTAFILGWETRDQFGDGGD